MNKAEIKESILVNLEMKTASKLTIEFLTSSPQKQLLNCIFLARASYNLNETTIVVKCDGQDADQVCEIPLSSIKRIMRRDVDKEEIEKLLKQYQEAKDE